MTEVEKKVSDLEQQVTTLANEAQSLEALITYAERQLKQSIEEITKIDNVNSPEGRHKLEEIVTSIFQTLKPTELKAGGSVEDVAQAKAMEDAVSRIFQITLPELWRRNVTPLPSPTRLPAH